MSKKKKKGLSANAKWGIALLVEILIMFLMVIGYAAFYIDKKYEKVQVLDLKHEDLAVNEGANEAQKGYTTIALFGIDARDTTNMGAGNRSDSIIIASINNDTKEVRLVSVYRDTLVELGDGSGKTTKVTHAYAYGGPELAVKTLNSNFDLEITEFVTVNFLALTKAIDDLGGVVVHVEQNELPVLNASVAEQISVTGIYSDGVFTTGDINLNGTQAVAYSRIRSTDRGDITRTERQREVISKMIQKAKGTDMATIDRIIDDVFPNVYTSITKNEMINLASDLFSYELADTAGFPFAQVPVESAEKGSILVPANLTANVAALHEYLFDTPNYTPTAKVQSISSKIESETGVKEQEVNIEIFTVE